MTLEKKCVWFTVPYQCERSVYGPVEVVMDDHDSWAVECAEFYHSECDGWDDEWPVTFSMRESEDGPEVCRQTVRQELVPQFYRDGDACKHDQERWDRILGQISRSEE